MRIEFDEEQIGMDDACPDLECEWNINGTCTCEGIMPCLDYEFCLVRGDEE